MSGFFGIDSVESDINKKVNEIEEHIKLISIEQAIRDLTRLSLSLVSLSSNENKKILFGSRRLDQYAMNIGALSLELLPKHNYLKSFDDSLFFYLASNIYPAGGHTRVILDFVKAQPSRRHVLVLTDIEGRRELGQEPTEWFKSLGVEVIWLEGRLLVTRLLALQALLIERRAATVFLLNHYHDVISIASCQPGLAKRFIYYHHCDHSFALGIYVSHFSHTDLSPRIFHTCRKQLGLDNYYLPLAVEDYSGSYFRKDFFQSNLLRTASSGTYNKYISDKKEDYFYIIASRLARLPGTHLHIGGLSISQNNRLQELLVENKIDPSRIIFLPWVESLWKALCEWNVDIYIPSFPQGGGRAMVEVMGAGVPIAVRVQDMGDLEELNGIELYYPEAYRWKEAEDLIRLLSNLDSEQLVDSGKNARYWYEKFHSLDQLERVLTNLPDALPKAIDVPSGDRFHTPIFLSIDKINPTNINPISNASEVRSIAFYLPQFHPIPENDQWWGKGFTEWRNVTRATPLFEGHYQPHLPSDLGFYDLRLPEILEEQAQLARRYGIYGFCYYYYWFNGHRLLETPIDNMLKLGKPDFPFCLCWANENWTRRWDGGENDILMAQTYDEVNAHQIIHDLIPFLLDHRYIRIDNKPVLLVYRTDIIPDVPRMLGIWRQEAKAAGLTDLYLVRVESFYICDPRNLGFDAACEFPPHTIYAPDVYTNQVSFFCDFKGSLKDYSLFADIWANRSVPTYKLFRGIMPGWDNTARRGSYATVFTNSSPEVYKNWLEKLVNYTLLKFEGDERLIFINAWNEWAEGCHLEPDIRYRHQFLETTRAALTSHTLIDSKYCNWFKKHQWNFKNFQILEKMSDQWISKPSINILMIVKVKEQGDMISKSIKSLEKQTLYLWKLAIIIPRGFDYTQLSERTEIHWMETDLGENVTQLLVSVDLDSEADWILICEPGTCFESVFCNLAGELINRHPEWRFVYTDEDYIDEQGNLSKPSLKPDCNLDLLRSSGYVGHACLIHSDLWRQIPANERINSLLLLNYAAALRCYEIFSETAIGHVDEILFHYPLEAAEDLKKFEESGKIILQQHLWRQGIFAEVSQGLVEGSFFVDYPLLYSPLVSIIIPTKNRFDLLQPCIESLLDKTRYSNYELIIIDNLSDDSATLEYFSYLKAHDQRIKIILYPKEYNYSAINNFAARQANGDFILFLNNDTVVLQENWLERLVSIGLRDDVGVVGCRLVYTDQRVQHAGVIIGLGGVAEHIGIGLPMSETGYMGRTQLTQNFSAVTAACMLVRKSLFFDVGGLDEKDFSVLYNDIDLCLKIREQGYRIVWTPFVTLIHHGNSSLKANPDPKRDEHGLLSRKAFIKKWLPRLGNDPAYNRHLSLRQREWMIDGDFDVPWHPDLEPLPRIVAQPPDEMGVGQYRMIGPLKGLTESGRISSFLLPPLNSEKRFLPFLSELSRVKPTVLFFQNAFTQLQTDDLQAYAELLPDIFRVFGQDDIVFSIPQKSAARKHFGKDTKARVRKAVSLCHRAIVTTEPIAEAMRGMVDDVRVVPNYLERSRWGDLQSPRKERRKLRVGWAGAQQHQGDLEFILPVVEATANEVDWIFMGLCPPKLRYHVAEAHNAVPFDQYPAALAALDLDLAIAPLEINRFNVAKSNLRLLEYGAVGYPVICTDIEPYRNAPVPRVPNNPQAWIDAIRAHVHEIDATRAAGEQLREWVLSNWMLDQHLNEWLKALLPD